MIVCPRCGKENQDHYKFCLGCGAELPAPESIGVAPTQAPVDAHQAMAEMAADVALRPTSESDAPAEAGAAVEAEQSAAPSPAQPDAAAAEGGGCVCPGCGALNPAGFHFCGSCGGKLGGEAPAAQAAAAPEPVPDAPAAETPAPGPRPMARLSLIRPDGSADGTHMLDQPEAIVGRGCGPLFDQDAYLSPHHARFYMEGQTLKLEDIGSLNGVFVRIEGQQVLTDGNVFRLGQELLRFNTIAAPRLTEDGVQILGSPNPGYWGRLSLVVGEGVDGSAFPLMGDEMVLGRERGDVLFSDDGYVSATHARLSLAADGSVVLEDMGSSNGTFVRITDAMTVTNGTYVLLGQQLFLIETDGLDQT